MGHAPWCTKRNAQNLNLSTCLETMAYVTLVHAVLGVAFLCAGLSRAQDCNEGRMRQCKNAIQDEVEGRTGAIPRQELHSHCRSIVENLHCLVEQAASCPNLSDRERASDTIYKAWAYIKNNCDNELRYQSNECFRREDLRQCNNLLPDNSRSTNQENCGKFANFKECVRRIVEEFCRSDDQPLMTLLILERGREKAWKCSSTDYTPDQRLAWQQQSLPLAETPDAQDAICLSRSAGPIRGCLDKYYDRKDDARRYRETQDRMHKECCSSLNFDRCVRDTVRDYCSYVRESVVQTILDQNGVRPDSRCRYYSDQECNSGLTLNSSVILLCLSLLTVLFHMRKEKTM